MAHRDFHHIIGARYHCLRQTVALGSHHYGKAWNGGEQWVVEADAVVGECHRRGFKAEVTQ